MSVQRNLCAVGALSSALLVAAEQPAFTQSADRQQLPQVTVEAAKPKPKRKPKPADSAPQSEAVQQSGTAGSEKPASLTVPNTAQATAAIERIPGSVAVIPDSAFKNTPAQDLKDIVDWTPGVWAQTKWGDDTRLSIRGSGLSRNYHLRSTQLYVDGIPMNTSDGYGDFQEIDPSAYRYVEVYKGANALAYGGNSLGGAINFVAPTGRDASPFDSRVDFGSFGFVKGQTSSGGSYGPADYYVSGTSWTADGYRNHSDGHGDKGTANFGYQFSPEFETRFYINANSVRQRIPGEVSKDTALNSPKTAAAVNITDDWQRNIDTVHVANKSTLKLDNTTIDFGAFAADRHLKHPIYQWLDWRYHDYGAFARVVDDRLLLDHRNRFTAGFYMLNGTIDANNYFNTGGVQTGLITSRVMHPENYTAYIENAWYVTPAVSLVTGTQFLHAVREQQVNFTLFNDAVPGKATYDILSPKVGIVWDVDKTWQVYGNISRSGEAPSFDEGTAAVDFTKIKAQTATTFEIGTRGRRPEVTWDVALYRADIRNELQCFFQSFGVCTPTNADRTVHQGVEAGLGVGVLRNIFNFSQDPDRVWLKVAYTYNDFFYNNDALFGNNRLPGAPPHYVRTELLYKNPNGFSIGPNVEWVPVSYYVDSANTLTTEPYALLGMRAAYDGQNYSAYIEGRNLTNKKYISSVSVTDVATPGLAAFWPGSGASVYAGIRYKM
ncbi:MAG: TonB-dependent receptor [Rhizobiales bacterium]|nr:TonB-dependent receptor [Hyphomicrobiales bacterium]